MNRLMVDMPEIIPAGDTAILMGFGEEMSLEVMAKCHSLDRAIEAEHLSGVRATVIGRSNLLVHFDPLVLSHNDITSLVERLVASGLEAVAPEGRMREIPTVYGGPYGPDLPYVAQHHQISEQEVVRLQSEATYTVCALGFAPGLPQLMGLPRQLAMRRKETPQPAPAGAVLVASQTVVYPVPLPSGWWLIGRTAVRLFDPSWDPPTYLLPGDQVRFLPISEQEYLKMGGERAE